MWPWNVNDIMHRKRARRILGIWEKSVSWVPGSERVSGVLPPKKKVDFRSSPRLCGGCHARVYVCVCVCMCVCVWGGADGKVVIERMCLSLPHVEKPFNTKVIKCFVPELRSRKCFLCFGNRMLSIYELCTFHVFISGYVTVGVISKQ